MMRDYPDVAESWQPLSDEVFDIVLELRKPCPNATWLDMFRTLLRDEWFQQELTRQARSVRKKLKLRPDLSGDIKDDAIVLLSEKLKRLPDLNANLSQFSKHFGAWMRRIIGRICMAAGQKLLLEHMRSRFHASNEPQCSSREQETMLIKLDDAIAELPEPEQQVVQSL
jgi:hypothetical protein